jgi:hypothetical protein
LFDPDQTPAGAHDDPDANKEGDNDAVIRWVGTILVML